MVEISRESLKGWAIAIVNEVEPNDAFVVQDGFDMLIEHWHRAAAQDEGRFIGGAEVASFAGVVVPFLLGFFGDVLKDVVKDQAKKAAGDLLDRLLKRRTTVDEAEALRETIDAAIKRSRFSSTEKATLRAGFAAVFLKLSPAR